IQFLDDQQTHMLPTEDADLAWIADSLGIQAREQGSAERPDCRSSTCQLLEALCNVREFVATEFDALLHDGRDPKGNGCKGCGGPPLPVDSEEFLAKLPDDLAPHVRQFALHGKVAM